MQRLLDSLIFSQPYFLGLLPLIVALLLMSGLRDGRRRLSGAHPRFCDYGRDDCRRGLHRSQGGEWQRKECGRWRSGGDLSRARPSIISTTRAQREAYLAGYEKGQSNAAKQQYWIARDNQRRRSMTTTRRLITK